MATLDPLQQRFIDFAAGDATAFEPLYETLAPPIYKFVLLKVRNRAWAEEIVQSVFVEAFKRASQLAAMDNAAGYLMIAARNKALDYLRNVGLERRTTEILSSAQLLRDSTNSMAEETHAELTGHLDNLPDEQREAVILHIYCNESYPRMSRILGCTEAIARYRYEKAIETLKRRMNRES